MKLHIKDVFNKKMPTDPIQENTRRQVHNSCFSFVKPKKPVNPELIDVSKEFAYQLGLTDNDVKSRKFLNIISGGALIENTNPHAMCYGGHQFDNWAGQLGDGRAINLAEIEHNDKRWALQLKGVGATPYSRSADGLAVLRSSIREHLCSEAMNKVNPKYVLRNYMVQMAIDDGEKENYNLIHEFYDLLQNPYGEQENHQKWFAKRPEWARKKVGSSMLSCSS